MAVDTTIPDSSNNVGDDLSAIRENFELLASAQVVDEGSTAEGDYIRYENGWQVCYYQDDETSITDQSIGSGHRSSRIEFSFPVGFSDIPNVAWLPQQESGATLWAGGSSSGGDVSISSSSASGNLLSFDDSIAEGKLGYFAIGRWK